MCDSEWIVENPCGVISLPTGKSPEYFIKTIERYKSNWNTPEVQIELISFGLNLEEFPSTSGLTFVMLDEFFPMNPSHRHSFCCYINNFYVKPLEININNVLDFDLIRHKVISQEDMLIFDDNEVIDLTLLTRYTSNDIEKRKKDILLKVKDYCDLYEKKIRDLGGIGFFLGGIGPDGHIAFNQEGSSHESTTRLVNFNYPTAAAAASDLGGIDHAYQKVTIYTSFIYSYNNIISNLHF